MANLISYRYANAMFDIAIENNEIDLFYEQFTLLQQVFLENKEFISIINHPEITKDEKSKLFNNVFENKVNTSILGMFDIMLKKNRETEIVKVISFFIKKVRKYKKISIAKISSPKILSEMQMNNIKDKLTSKLNRQVILEICIDETLIGGLCIEVDGYIIDASIKKQLSDIKSLLKNNQIV